MTTKNCILQSCFLCTHCLPEWAGAIAANRQVRHYKKGQQIFREGEEVQGIWFILSGAIKVYQSWGEDKDIILRFAAAGDVLGHRGKGNVTVLPISATTLEQSTVCFISSSFLETTLKTNPPFLYAMMQLYASELQKAEKRMRNLARMEVKGRIANTLFTILATFGVDGEGYIKVPVTRNDIASHTGTTYETVFRTLTEWSAKSFIDTSGKSIRIKDPRQLQALIR